MKGVLRKMNEASAIVEAKADILQGTAMKAKEKRCKQRDKQGK
jgi:hypothetical protein